MLEPGPTEMAAIGAELPPDERMVLIADAAHASVLAHLATDEAQARLDGIGSA